MATSFADLQPDRIVSVETYLASISSVVKRQMAAELIGSATAIFEQIRFSLNASAEAPSLRIANSDSPSAQSMEGMVEISSGLIDYCLGIPYANTFTALGLDTSFLHDLIPTAALMWFYAHECHHIVRGHHRLTEALGYDEATMKATELDADLCAVASIYRVFQAMFAGKFQDDQIRKLLLYCLFWALRDLTDKPQLTHSRTDERLRNAALKLAMIEVVPFGSFEKVDQSFERPETRARGKLLFESVRDTELLYRRMNPGASIDFDPGLRLLENSDRTTIQRWDEICITQSILTGQLSFKPN